jgi:hypothetical protein
MLQTEMCGISAFFRAPALQSTAPNGDGEGIEPFRPQPRLVEIGLSMRVPLDKVRNPKHLVNRAENTAVQTGVGVRDAAQPDSFQVACSTGLCSGSLSQPCIRWCAEGTFGQPCALLPL